MGNFGVELQTIDSPPLILDSSQCIISFGYHLKSRWSNSYVITVAHPDRKFLVQSFQQPAVIQLFYLSGTIFSSRRRLDLTSEEIADKLQTIANPEYRCSEAQNFRRAMGRAFLIDRTWPSGKNDSSRL